MHADIATPGRIKAWRGATRTAVTSASVTVLACRATLSIKDDTGSARPILSNAHAAAPATPFRRREALAQLGLDVLG